MPATCSRGRSFVRRGEQEENATGWRFLEAKSSTQGAEGRGYAPTRGDYAAGQGGIPDQGLYPFPTSPTPQHPVPCHSERAARRVELLRHAAKALWALAPCGIWDGLLCLHCYPARSRRASKEKTPRCGVFSKRSPRHKELKERATPRRATTMWQDREATVPPLSLLYLCKVFLSATVSSKGYGYEGSPFGRAGTVCRD